MNKLKQIMTISALKPFQILKCVYCGEMIKYDSNEVLELICVRCGMSKNKNTVKKEGKNMTENENLCFKCGVSRTEKKLIHHHLNAKDYCKAGDEKLVLCCLSCHTKIHLRIREKNLCPLSVEETKKLSSKSYQRRYNKNVHKQKISCETVMPNVQLFEQVHFNQRTGNITVSSCFCASNGKEILYLGEKDE